MKINYRLLPRPYRLLVTMIPFWVFVGHYFPVSIIYYYYYLERALSIVLGMSQLYWQDLWEYSVTNTSDHTSYIPWWRLLLTKTNHSLQTSVSCVTRISLLTAFPVHTKRNCSVSRSPVPALRVNAVRKPAEPRSISYRENIYKRMHRHFSHNGTSLYLVFYTLFAEGAR